MKVRGLAGVTVLARPWEQGAAILWELIPSSISPILPSAEHFILLFFWGEKTNKQKPTSKFHEVDLWMSHSQAGVGKAAGAGAVTPNCSAEPWYQHSLGRRKSFPGSPSPGLLLLPRAFPVFLEESPTQPFLPGSSWPSGAL